MKNKIFKQILFLIVLIFKLTSVVNATESVAGSSAKLAIAPSGANKNVNLEEYNSLAKQREALRRVFERAGSPLITEVDTFIEVAQKYRLPVYFLPSITGLESSFGQALIPGTYNPFGWGPHIPFENWADAIETVGRGLRTRYVPDGSEITPWKVGPTYAESPTWAVRVESFMGQFEAEEQKIQLKVDEISI